MTMPAALPSTDLPTLRSWLDDAITAGTLPSLEQAVSVVVPVAVEAAERHAAGATLYLHPSNIVHSSDHGWIIADDLTQLPPPTPADEACMAPEERQGKPGTARASIYAIGAIFYELITGARVGPGMARPTELAPGLPAAVEAILAKALVGDPAHRPDDLNALAQALHHLAPGGTVPPPAADESHLDHGSDFDVDVSLSMVPPAPPAATGLGGVSAGTPYDVAIHERPAPSGKDMATQELTKLKQRLESDPRPRYVVIKDGMDHGPFSAVELLQQIASHTFEPKDALRDELSSTVRAIQDWPEFAPFAEHAKRHRLLAAEKVAIQEVVEQERKSTQGKAFMITSVIGAVLAIAGVWFLARAGTRNEAVTVHSDVITEVDTNAALAAGKGAGSGRGGRRVLGQQGGIPILAGGMSCEAAQAAYVEEIKVGQKGQADITQAQYGAVLNSGSYLNGCGVPAAMSVGVCVAVQNGRAVGVTVSTKPHNGAVSGCIASKVRQISFPAHPKLDVTRTFFAAQ